MEFFSKDCEKFRDTVLSEAAAKAAISDQTMDPSENQHDCRCNMCGDDMNIRSQKLAEIKFNSLKEEL